MCACTCCCSQGLHVSMAPHSPAASQQPQPAAACLLAARWVHLAAVAGHLPAAPAHCVTGMMTRWTPPCRCRTEHPAPRQSTAAPAAADSKCYSCRQLQMVAAVGCRAVVAQLHTLGGSSQHCACFQRHSVQLLTWHCKQRLCCLLLPHLCQVVVP
jgi:hypothetical protein